jgi:hypothetical protein
MGDVFDQAFARADRQNGRFTSPESAAPAASIIESLGVGSFLESQPRLKH